MSISSPNSSDIPFLDSNNPSFVADIPVDMAIISSQNRTCASETLLESYRSPIYTLQIIFNCLIPIASMFFLGRATYQQCSQSIIQYSTRVLLITTIMFAACHQAAYFSFKVSISLFSYFYVCSVMKRNSFGVEVQQHLSLMC